MQISIDVLRTLLEITIYSAALFAAIMVFKTINKGKLSPALSFVLWFLLIIRLCVPITLQSAFHLFTLPQAQQQTEQDATSTTTPYVPQQDAQANAISPSSQMPVQQLNQQVKQQVSQQVSQVQNTVAPQNTFNLSIYDALAIVWLGGMLLFAVRTAVLASRMAKVIKNRSIPAPADIEELYASCRQEMGIKKRLPLFVTQNLLSPALVVSVRPKILLPGSFAVHATKEQMRLALCHELVHYKRLDHWVCMLLRILSVVYWFNPVLWMAEKEITADMETACDNRIVRNMQKDEKAFYANTILSMFSAHVEAPFVLGLALPGTKQIAEKRIRGIFTNSKTKKGVKLAAILLALILLVSCFTTACQPVLAASGNALTSNAATENQYKETKKLNDIVTVKYDADIVQPSAVPQATLKVRTVTEADMQKVVDYFLAGRQIYEPWTPTKTEVQNHIQSLQQRSKDHAKKDAFIAQHAWAAELYQAYLNSDFEDNNQTDQIKTKYNLSDRDMAAFKAACYEAGTDDWLLNYETAALASAPDTATKKPAEIHFRVDGGFTVGPVDIGEKKYTRYTTETSDWYTVWAENPDGTYAQVDGASEYGEPFGWVAYYRAILAEPKPLTISMDQALKTAEQAVAAISPDLSLAASITQDNRYVFNFTRKVSGVPISYDSHADYEFAYQKENNPKMIPYENIKVTVNDGGVSRLEWQNPYTDIQITNPNAKVISMDAAKQKFEANVLAILKNSKYADVNDNSGKMDSIALDINRIELGLTRIQDDKGNFSLVPTWDFYGKATAIKGGQEQIFNRFGLDQDNDSLGTVNALDGSEIKRAGLLQQW